MIYRHRYAGFWRFVTWGRSIPTHRYPTSRLPAGWLMAMETIYLPCWCWFTGGWWLTQPCIYIYQSYICIHIYHQYVYIVYIYIYYLIFCTTCFHYNNINNLFNNSWHFSQYYLHISPDRPSSNKYLPGFNPPSRVEEKATVVDI